MPYIAYQDYNPKPETAALIRWADAVARDYKSRGLDLTLRQLYYQGVSQNLFPNSERSYKNLGNAITMGRLGGRFDWDLLEDRTRNAGNTAWFGREIPTIQSLIEKTRWQRTLDPWAGQERRIEVWVEKQALEQVAQRAAQEWRVPYLACKGYMSASEMWDAGYNRLGDYIAEGHSPLILHIGDHDPSGIDMTRDIEERLSLFAGGSVEVRRLALNWDQIEAYNPPPNPAKLSDSRAKGYIQEYGSSSWELDALRPELLIQILQDEIRGEVDQEMWDARMAEEDAAIAEMKHVADRWDDIAEFLAGGAE
ncbi:hypothetical protein [Leifsonia aquatica]|uniref:hypothetical protein n=1 Tax=Leifsonia aquatica TaxID=144185 RepID=UPI000469AA56|nr:hypothetical protein [Leifsonia aquatica]